MEKLQEEKKVVAEFKVEGDNMKMIDGEFPLCVEGHFCLSTNRLSLILQTITEMLQAIREDPGSSELTETIKKRFRTEKVIKPVVEGEDGKIYQILTFALGCDIPLEEFTSDKFPKIRKLLRTIYLSVWRAVDNEAGNIIYWRHFPEFNIDLVVRDGIPTLFVSNFGRFATNSEKFEFEPH